MVGTTVTCEQGIVSGSTEKVVVSTAAGDAVIASQAVENVAKARSSEIVVSPRP
jgi:hypothetical protein